MSDSPLSAPESEKESESTRDSAVAWKLGGAVLGAAGLVVGARVQGVPNEYRELVNPFIPVLLAIIALIGANVGALVGLLVSRFRQERAATPVLTNSDASSVPPQEASAQPVKQWAAILATINTGITVGGLIGAFGGWVYLALPPAERKGEYSMGILLLPALALKGFSFLLQVTIFATAGATIGALLGSLVCNFRAKG